MFTDRDLAIRKREKFPKLRKYNFLSLLKIAADSGFLVEQNRHVDFWMFKSFDPVSAIVRTEGIANG